MKDFPREPAALGDLDQLLHRSHHTAPFPSIGTVMSATVPASLTSTVKIEPLDFE